MTEEQRVRVLLNRDPWAIEEVERTAAALNRRWTPQRFARNPHGPPELRVLRDWLIEREIEIEPVPLARIVRAVRNTWRAARPFRPREADRLKDPILQRWPSYPNGPYRQWALDQVAAHGREYRRRLNLGEIEAAKVVKVHRTIWARRALEARDFIRQARQATVYRRVESAP